MNENIDLYNADAETLVRCVSMNHACRSSLCKPSPFSLRSRQTDKSERDEVWGNDWCHIARHLHNKGG
jgi:hypothetical protein